MMLLLWMSAGVIVSTGPVRAYASISFALNNDGALTFSLVNQSSMSITPVTNADGEVS